MTDRRSSSWLFGYGSLVSRSSFEYTFGRHLTPGTDFHLVDVAGWARRWSFSIRSVPGSAVEAGVGSCAADEWTITVLGLIESPNDVVNGVIGRVTEAELAAFDERERTYERVDVTARTRGVGVTFAADPVITFVPTDVPRQRYERARAVGSAVVDAQYRRLVERSFASLGDEQHRRYRATTPDPEVPTVRLADEHVPPSHRHLVG